MGSAVRGWQRWEGRLVDWRTHADEDDVLEGGRHIVDFDRLVEMEWCFGDW
jgi:hypothetical protein